MLNPEKLLNQAVKAIDKRETTISGRYHICCRNGKILCLKSSAFITRNEILGTYSDDELSKGLTTKQWDRLCSKLADFWIRKESICEHQKP